MHQTEKSYAYPVKWAHIHSSIILAWHILDTHTHTHVDTHWTDIKIQERERDVVRGGGGGEREGKRVEAGGQSEEKSDPWFLCNACSKFNYPWGALVQHFADVWRPVIVHTHQLWIGAVVLLASSSSAGLQSERGL